ncbi:MAG: hypothetical protein N2167_06480 [Flavobacteriales bacterium]|nr:hypothetical protein [Flavobacteriales bacterium]
MLKTWIKHPTLRGIIYFFPFQLLLLHLQRNQGLLLFWLLVAGYITHSIGADYGMPYLFLYPEYMGGVTIASYAIIGFAWGGFVMAFNISSFIINSHRFPFLATLSRPFMKYSLNNFIIPALFTIIYIYHIVYFLRFSEFYAWTSIYFLCGSFLGGMILFILISLGYFLSFNRDYISVFGMHPEMHEVDGTRKKRIKKVKIGIVEKINLKNIKDREKYAEEWIVETYLRNPFSIRRTRSSEHYERAKLMQIFKKNHINAAIFEIFVIVSLIILGLFREIPFFKIPAGASILLFITMLLMLAGAIHFVMRRWSTVFFIGLFLLINFLSRYPQFHITNYAYGLDYSNPVIYKPTDIQQELNKSRTFETDRMYHFSILNNWKKKVQKRTGKKPKIVIINCSGGGLKSALWTFYSIQQTDKALHGELLKHTFLITGSSGGMIGASFIRELYLLKQLRLIDDLYHDSLAMKIASDLLNPITTSIALNDFFIRLQSFSEGSYRYPKDRGYAFERQLNENTDYLMDKRLSDYAPYEEKAMIPLMIFSPAIINDGKRLIISPLPMSFMSYNAPINGSINKPILENIEFIRLFKQNKAQNLKFTTAIRMNATFPYILPTVSLPSKPSMEIMDAGLRDNYGTRTAITYLFHVKDWINQHTSGVILIRTHDSRQPEYNPQYIRTYADNLLSPLGGLLNNISKIHLQENDQLIQFASAWLNVPIHVFDYKLAEIITGKEISMSLHLTTKEKIQIMEAFQHPSIQDNIRTMETLLK